MKSNLPSLFLLIIVAIYGCSDTEKDIKSELKFLVLEECKNKTISFLSSLSPELGLSYIYEDFNFNIPSHSEVVGYIDVKSTREDVNSLKTYANRLLSDCYPSATTKILINGNEYVSEISNIIEMGQNTGNNKQYIKVKGREIQVYFKELKSRSGTDHE